MDFCDYCTEGSQESALEILKQWLIQNCPVLYRQSELSRLNPQFLEACNTWQMGCEGLGLFGPTGSTKTRCMWELIRRISQPYSKIVPGSTLEELEKGKTCERYFLPTIHVVRDVDFARECADQFKDGHNGKKLRSWRTCDVLFIDDLGKSRITERVQTELFDLVDSRTSNGLPILWTSNFSAKNLSNRFASPDEAGPIIRRLVESCRIVKAAP